jgi:hypothetical protein
MPDLNKLPYNGFLGMSLVAVYGILTRLIFGMQGVRDTLGGVVTLGFIFFVPLALGALTVVILPRRLKTSWVVAVFFPWLTCMVVTGLLAIFLLEAVFCVILGLPIFLPLSSLGGIIVWYFASQIKKDTTQVTVVIFLVLPYLVAGIESRFPTPTAIRTVASQVVIAAPAEVVWQKIISVPEIQPEEHHLAAFWLLGAPKPVQAMLPIEAVGAMRRSSYEGNLFFVEEVTAWQAGQFFSFTIDLDPQVEAPWPWDQIGGPYFDLLDGGYRIEPLDDHQVILHLSSRHRLSTKLNGYGGWWTDFILGDIQDYILAVIKGRAEAF